jgi:membrane protein implicated in regulation of membrane protease activity
VVWFRISGLVLLIAGALALLLIPMWGRHIAFASVALIIVGAVTLAAGTRLRRFRDSESGGVYGDASGVNTDFGGGHHHGGHDGGHGGDGGH